MRTTLFLALVTFLLLPRVYTQEESYYQTDFPPGEFAARRAEIFRQIGPGNIALIQGNRDVTGFTVFRQSNTFYYLSGLETPRSYLLLDGRSKTTTVYLPLRDPGRERSEGKTLSAEDAELVKKLTGIDHVKPLDRLSLDLVGAQMRPPSPALYTPFSPAEIGTDSRDELLRGKARAEADPWDSTKTRRSEFIQLLRKRVPQLEIKDLSPTLDAMRLVKSPAEIALVERATRIAGDAIIESMRSTAPGVMEYQLDAAAKYIFYTNGARGDGYASIVGGGKNAFMGHYFRKTDALKSGDLVLMDYAPDYRYYTSDVTRIWPVNGKFTPVQLELYEYIVAYRDALFRYVKPGVTSDFVLDNAARDMKRYLEGKTFSKPEYRKAVEAGIKFRGHFQHSVGMAVHDVGRLRGVKLRPGMIFTIDPMIWVPEEKLYVRIEDMALVTKTGVKNLSAFVPSKPADVERTIAERGIVEFRPAQKP